MASNALNSGDIIVAVIDARNYPLWKFGQRTINMDMANILPIFFNITERVPLGKEPAVIQERSQVGFADQFNIIKRFRNA